MKRIITAIVAAGFIIASGYTAEAQVKIRREKSSGVVTRKVKPQQSIKQQEEVVGSVLNIEQTKGRSRIWISLRNQDGEPIKTLTTNQFRVIETINGVSREVPQSDISLDDQPLAVVLLRDVSQSMSRSDLRYSKRVLQTFIEKMSEKDRTELIFFSDNVSVIQPMTSSKRRLKSALNLPFGQGGTALYDSIIFATNRLKKLDDAGFKRAILVFTDGVDSASSNSPKEMLTLASASSIPTFTIGVGNANASVLHSIAKSSRGLSFRASSTTALETIYTSISHILRGSYVLSFETAADRGEKVEVEITASIDDAKKVAQFYGTYVAK